MSQTFAADYVDVAARIAEFREKYPDGSLQPNDRSKPYTIEQIGDETYIVYVAAAYRSPTDALPGVGAAYEKFPGRTPYTKGSELQNAETSAWGRAIVAALAADTKKGIASADEVRNRQAERNTPEDPKAALYSQIRAVSHKLGRTDDAEIIDDFAGFAADQQIEAEKSLKTASATTLQAYVTSLHKEATVKAAS